jgi:hypothetical protein
MIDVSTGTLADRPASPADQSAARRPTTSVTLEAWARCAWADGLDLDTLPDQQVVLVETRNTMYELVVAPGGSGHVLVRGGRFFPRFTPAHVAGSTLGGTIVKLYGVYPGLRLEFRLDGRCIVTSAIRRVARLDISPANA